MEEIQAEAGKKIFAYNFAIKLHAGFQIFFVLFCLSVISNMWLSNS